MCIAPLVDSAHHKVLLRHAQDVGNGGQLRVDVVNHVPKVMECDGPHCSVGYQSLRESVEIFGY